MENANGDGFLLLFEVCQSILNAKRRNAGLYKLCHRYVNGEKGTGLPVTGLSKKP
jgi:hypothetical protein